MMQGFFAAGEVSGGAIFVLEHTPPTQRSLASSCYDACAIGGVLLASGIVTLLSAQSLIEQGWRYLFWAGGATAIIGIIFRLQSSKMVEESAAPKVKKVHLFLILKRYAEPLLGIIFAAGFSYTTYSLAFTLMNGFVPLVTSLSKTQTMQVNTLLLVFDMLLLPIMGYVANRVGKEKVMLAGALCATVLAIPMFYLLDHASLGTVIAIRLAMISCGVAFAAPYYAWAMERVPSRHRYLILSLAAAIGSQCIGMPSSAICLWLYQTLGWSWAPGLYLQATGLMAGLAVFLFMRKEKMLALHAK
jgi:MFS family permease